MNLVIVRRKLRIVKATYGANDKHVDITTELNNQVLNDHLRLVLNNGIAGDPCPGIRKTGNIEYQYKGKKHTVQYSEDGVVDLPESL